MTRKNLTILLGIVILVSLGCAWYFVEKNQAARPLFHVAILKTARHASFDVAEKAFIAALTKEFKKDISFTRRSQEGSLTQGQIIVQQFMQDKGLSLVFALGTGASLAAYSKLHHTPLIVGAVDNPEMLGIVNDDELICGFSDAVDLEAHIAFLKEIKPAIKRVGVLFSFKESNARSTAASMHHRLKNEGFIPVDIAITDYYSLDKLLGKYKDSIDLLWAPSDNGVASNIEVIANYLVKMKVPFISCDQSLVEAGAIAALGVNYHVLGERAGYAALRILRNDRKPIDYGINNRQETILKINKQRCEELNLKVPELISHQSKE